MNTHSYTIGQRVVWNGGPGTVVAFGKKGIPHIKWDYDHDNDLIQEPEQLDHIEPYELLTLEECATIGKEPDPNVYRGYGYVIASDGTIYTLRKQYYHGVVLALLYPEEREKQGFPVPVKRCIDVYNYQRFELDNHRSFPVIRVAFGLLGITVSKGKAGCSPEQVDALRKVFKRCKIALTDTITCEYSDVTARKCLQIVEKADAEHYLD